MNSKINKWLTSDEKCIINYENISTGIRQINTVYTVGDFVIWIVANLHSTRKGL